MIDKVETKKPSISELVAMHRRIAELEASETQHKRVDKVLRQAQAELTKQVRERTMELAKAKEKLRIEIDEHKELEELADILAAVGRRNIVAVRTSTDAISVASPVDGKLLFCNDAFLKRWKIKDDYHNLRYSDCFDVDPGSDVLMKASQTTMAGGWSGELTGKAMDGQTFPIQVNTAPVVNKEGSVVGLLGIFKDITESKRAEEALQESEERFRDLLENANDLIQSVAPDGHFLYVNKTWRKILGYSEKEVANLMLWDIIHPDSISRCKEVFQRVMSGGMVSNFEAVFVAKDGKLVPVEGNVNCRFGGGKPVSTRGIFRDITDRKQSGEALRESEERLQLIFQSANDGIAIVDPKGVVTDCNQRAVEIFGCGTKEEILGKCLLEFIAQDERQKAAKDIQKIMAGELIEPHEYTVTRIDGSTLAIEVSTAVMNDISGKPSGLVAVIRDISERKLLIR